MCSVDIDRRLEDGCLPILRSVQRDGEVEYHLTMFATLEAEPLSAPEIAAIFGIGWGLFGYCPGPAITALTYLQPQTLIFALCMIIGMLIYEYFVRLEVKSQ